MRDAPWAHKQAQQLQQCVHSLHHNPAETVACFSLSQHYPGALQAGLCASVAAQLDVRGAGDLLLYASQQPQQCMHRDHQRATKPRHACLTSMTMFCCPAGWPERFSGSTAGCAGCWQSAAVCQPAAPAVCAGGPLSAVQLGTGCSQTRAQCRAGCCQAPPDSVVILCSRMSRGFSWGAYGYCTRAYAKCSKQRVDTTNGPSGLVNLQNLPPGVPSNILATSLVVLPNTIQPFMRICSCVCQCSCSWTRDCRVAQMQVHLHAKQRC